MISATLGSSRKFHELRGISGELWEFPQTLYMLLIPKSDDFGRLQGDSFTVKFDVFPTSPRSEAEFDAALKAMHTVELIQLYEVNSKRYIQIINFDNEQTGLHKRTKSRFPDPQNLQAYPGNSGKFPEIPSEEKRTEENRREEKKEAPPAPLPPASSQSLPLPCESPEPEPWRQELKQRLGDLAVSSVFKHWNEQPGLTHHKTIVGQEKYIQAALKAYSLSEIKTAISRYSEVRVNAGGKYRTVHPWTLGEFLSREGHKNLVRFNAPNWEEAFISFDRGKSGPVKDPDLYVGINDKDFTPQMTEAEAAAAVNKLEEIHQSEMKEHEIEMDEKERKLRAKPAGLLTLPERRWLELRKKKPQTTSEGGTAQ